MKARILLIEEKLRVRNIGMVRPTDFRTRDDGAVDPGIVLQVPNISLYCLDFENRQALFVETPSECDISDAPFLYAAQNEAARRLIQVPFAALHRLADEIAIDPARLILIYSTGRCGSTLVSRAFQAIPGVDSLSEPDVFTQMLGTWGPDDLDGDEQAALLRSCTLMQCAPGRTRGATAWALKFRSEVTALGPLFYSIFPEAKVVFLYRHAAPWVRSYLRLRGGDPLMPVSVDRARAGFGRIHARLEPKETVTALEFLAQMWISPMKMCLEMQRRGIPMFIARYEELNAAPREVLAQMFAHCGLSIDAARNLDVVLERDSQEGTALSRTSVGEGSVPVAQQHLDELRRLIREGSTELTADTIIPGTYFPASIAVEGAA
jgi:hypothetical protein